MGGVIFLNVPNEGEVYFFNKTTGQWTTLAVIPMPYRYHPVGQYNPVHKLVIFGGGNTDQTDDFRDLYKLDASGKITRMKDTPVTYGIRQSLLTVDPVSGKYLLFKDSGEFYEYDVTTDTWKRQGPCQGTPCQGRPFPFFEPGNGGVFDVIETPISTYGVNMFVKYWKGSTPPAVYLYKHASSPADLTPPAAPTGLKVQ